MKRACLVAVLATAGLTSGCASIVTGYNQSLSIETRTAEAQVAGANCKLSNDKGTWFVISPGSTTVQRSYGDLTVHCEKEGMQPGLLTAKSTTKGMAFGNILFGGIIGAGVDIATGAAYDYPALISVEMGKTTQVPSPVEPEVSTQAQASRP